jgi:hypothetical protein
LKHIIDEVSSSISALVSQSSPRRLRVCHFKKGTEICQYSYSNTILAVKLNRARLGKSRHFRIVPVNEILADAVVRVVDPDPDPPFFVNEVLVDFAVFRITSLLIRIRLQS